MDSEHDLFEPGVVQLLMTGFDLSRADVTADARRVLQWRSSNDDLFVAISKRHRWPASTTARYLREMWFALRRRARSADEPPEA